MRIRNILRHIGRALSKAASFLTTAVIVAAAAVLAMYLLKIRPYVVTTGSMEPAIPVGSICFVNEKTPFEDIKSGDVVSFRMGNELLVTHRVTAADGDSLTTKGDANNSEDASPVTKENYIGKTVLVVPKAGYVLVLLHSGKGRIFAAVLIALLFVLSFIPKREDPGKSP